MLEDAAAEKALGVTKKPAVTLISTHAFGIWFSNKPEMGKDTNTQRYWVLSASLKSLQHVSRKM